MTTSPSTKPSTSTGGSSNGAVTRRRSSATSATAASSARAAQSANSTSTQHKRSSSSSSSKSTSSTSSVGPTTATGRSKSMSNEGKPTSTKSSRDQLSSTATNGTKRPTTPSTRRRSESSLSSHSRSSSRSSNGSPVNNRSASSAESNATANGKKSSARTNNNLTKTTSTTGTSKSSGKTSTKSAKKKETDVQKQSDTNTRTDPGARSVKVNKTVHEEQDGRTITTYEEVIEEVVDADQIIEKIEIINGVECHRFYQVLPDGTMEEVEEVEEVTTSTNATSEQTLVTVNEEGGQQENADPLLLDEEHDAERILHAAANARRGMKGKLGLQESKDTKQSRVMTTDGTSSNASIPSIDDIYSSDATLQQVDDNEATTSPIVRTVSGDLDDSEDEEGEEDYTLTIHSHWDQEKVSVKDPYDIVSPSRIGTMSPTKLIPSAMTEDTTRNIAAMYENSPSSTYASVAAHSRPSIGAGTFASDALADNEARSTASHDTSAQSNTNKDTAQERGFAPGSGLMVKLAAKGAAEEVSDFVEDTTDTYVPKPMANAASKAASAVSDMTTQLLGKPPTSLVTSVKEQLTQTLASAAANDDDDEENNTRWKCKTCREERARDASWLNWITHPVTMVLDHIHSSNDEDEPCDQHRTITQKLTYLVPKWMRSKRQHSKSSYNKSRNISNDDKSQQCYSISVTSNAYVNAEQDGYGRRISQVERARRMHLAQQAQQRVNMLRGGNDNGAATTAAVDDDGKTNRQNGIVVRVVGTVVGTAVGISMAAIDAVWH